MLPALEDPSVGGIEGQGIEIGWVEGSQAAPDGQVVGAGYNLQGIDLYATELVGNLENSIAIRFGFRSICGMQALSPERKGAENGVRINSHQLSAIRQQ